MLARRTLNAIHDQKQIRFHEQKLAAMREAAVSALGRERVFFGHTFPIESRDIGLLFPTERTVGHGLIERVDANRVVRGAAAEGFAQSGIGISKRAWIDEDFARARAGGEAQRIRMAVRGIARTKWAAIDNDLVIAGPHYGDAGIVE